MEQSEQYVGWMKPEKSSPLHVWFKLYGVKKQPRLIYSDRGQNNSYILRRGTSSEGTWRPFWDAKKVLYLDLSGGYECIHVRKLIELHT